MAAGPLPWEEGLEDAVVVGGPIRSFLSPPVIGPGVGAKLATNNFFTFLFCFR